MDIYWRMTIRTVKEAAPVMQKLILMLRLISITVMITSRLLEHVIHFLDCTSFKIILPRCFISAVH